MAEDHHPPEALSTRPRLAAPLVVLGFACALLLGLASRFWPYVITDDAYISYRYAENLAAGHGLVFNQGERVEGFSNFLYVLMLAALARIHVDLTAASRFIGVASGIGSVLALAGLGRRLAPGVPAAAWLAPLLLATSVPFGIWAVAGLETLPYGLLILIALTLHLGERQTGEGWPWSAVFFLAAAIMRPEGIVVFTAACVLHIIAHWPHRLFEKRSLLWLGAVLVPYTLYVTWRWMYFESLLPNSVYAKSGGDATRLILGLRYLLSFVQGNEGLVFYLAAATGLLLRSGLGYPHALVAVCLVGELTVVVIAGGDWMPASRLIVPVLPLVYLLVQEGTFGLWEKLASPAPLPPPKVIALLLLIAAVFGTLRYESYRDERRVVIREHSKWTQYDALGRWMRDNLPRGSTVALGSAGLIPFRSGLRIIDMYGLMDRTIARTGKAYREGSIFTRTDARYVLSRKPEYVLVYAWPTSDGARLDGSNPYSRDMLAQADFHARYRVLRTQPRYDSDHGELMLLYKKLD